MEKTVGVFIFNPLGQLLVCHPNEIKADRWGIPKGRPDPTDKSMGHTAFREVLEETGIDLRKYAYVTEDDPVGNFEFIGSEKYSHKEKILHAYVIKLPTTISRNRLECRSLFTSRYSGKRIPEIDDYKWVDFHDYKHKIQSEQVRLLERYLTE